jgi:hypothetical protein
MAAHSRSHAPLRLISKIETQLMTAFSDDLSGDLNLRAWRLVAASLQAPVAQPAWTDALLTSLTPPLPLVDWDPLSAWSSMTGGETASGPGTSPSQPTRIREQDSRLVSRAGQGESLTSGRKVSQSPVLGDLVAPPPSRPRLDSDLAERRSGVSLAAEPDPTVPSRAQGGAAAGTLYPTTASSPAPSPASGPFPSPGAASFSQPYAWPAARRGAIAPLGALAEIGRLTAEILTGDEATAGERNLRPSPDLARSPNGARAAGESPSPAIAPAPGLLSSTPPSPPASKLDLAGLAALYSGTAPGAGDRDAVTAVHRGLVSTPGAVGPVAAAFSTPDLGHGPSLDVALSDLAPDLALDLVYNGVGSGTADVAETLTEMVSAILQAQAQRHGVNLS